MKPAEGSTIIGKSVKIRGELSGKEDLFMDGDIEGTITLPDNRLTVGPNARVLAHIHVRDIVVFGAVDGNIHAAGRIDVRRSATVHGDLFAGRLSIEESATIKGRVELTVAGSQVQIIPPAAAVGVQESLILEPKA
jgi:cytoskeletal protein CcmA (bactofilin family)